MKRYDIHPLVKDLFPLLPEKELAELATNIKEVGQTDPIVLFEKKIIDGANRQDACFVAGIEPRTVGFESMPQFVNGSMTPVQFVLAANLFRRHLTESQRTAVVVEAEKR